MSQQLDICLRHKNGTKVCIGTFYTTIARELSAHNTFHYTQDYVVLDVETLKEYIGIVKEEILGSSERYIKSYTKRKNEIEKLIMGSTSKESVKALLEEIEDINVSLEEIDETMEEEKYILEVLEGALRIYEYNKEYGNKESDWGLVYVNC